MVSRVVELDQLSACLSPACCCSCFSQLDEIGGCCHHCLRRKMIRVLSSALFWANL